MASKGYQFYLLICMMLVFFTAMLLDGLRELYEKLTGRKWGE